MTRDTAKHVLLPRPRGEIARRTPSLGPPTRCVGKPRGEHRFGRSSAGAGMRAKAHVPVGMTHRLFS
jgi:hypothetical protein